MTEGRPILDDLIRAQRGAVGLSEAQRAANRTRLLTSVSAAGASLALSAGAKASVGASGWLVKGALGLALGCGATAAFFATSEAEPVNVLKVPERSLIRERPTQGEPIDEPPRLEQVVAAPQTTESARLRRPRATLPRSTASSSSLSAELQLMHEVNAALKAGQPQRALARLEERRDGDAGYMREEREAARVFALCQAGNQRAARAEASAFLRNYPHSPLARRVGVTCVSSSPMSAGSKSKG